MGSEMCIRDRPITQAAYAHGDRTMINFLLDLGADPTLLVGPPDDLCNLFDMARRGGHNNLASELESIVDKRYTNA